MYIIELERTNKKLHKKGGVTISGITVFIRRTIPGLQTETELLAERFFEGTAGSIQLQDGIEHGVLLLPAPLAEKEVKP